MLVWLIAAYSAISNQGSLRCGEDSLVHSNFWAASLTLLGGFLLLGEWSFGLRHSCPGRFLEEALFILRSDRLRLIHEIHYAPPISIPPQHQLTVL